MSETPLKRLTPRAFIFAPVPKKAAASVRRALSLPLLHSSVTCREAPGGVA